MDTLPRNFDLALAELGLSGPVYRVEEAGDGGLTLHLPAGTFEWRPGGKEEGRGKKAEGGKKKRVPQPGRMTSRRFRMWGRRSRGRCTRRALRRARTW